MFDRKEDAYRFVFDSGYTLLIRKEAFYYHTLISMENESLLFEFSPEPVLSGMFAYCLFETYGFPLEFAADEMKRKGMSVDETGFHVMEKLARERNKNTFNNKDAFG